MLDDLLVRADVRAARRILSVRDARRAARKRLPSVVFDYVDGAADDEMTMRRNEDAFGAVSLSPKMASGSFEPSLGVSVLGKTVDFPVLLAPCGLVRLLHADGPAGVARAAASRGTVSVLSTVAGSPVEAVAEESNAPMWFQLYSATGLSAADALCERVAAAGVEVLVVTVDTPTIGNRERDVRHGVEPPLRVDAHNAVPLGMQVLARPRWAARLAATGIRLSRSGAGPTGHGAGPTGHGAGPTGHGGGLLSAVASPFSWDDVAYLRKRWHGPFVVKGVLSGADARRAVDSGADGVVVSNHGGRQLEGAPATLQALPGVLAAVGSDVEVLVDGGIRRGWHVVAALALGARAVLIGRPYLFGLAAAGEPGVARVLDILRAEMRRTMILLGCPSVDQLGPEWLEGH